MIFEKHKKKITISFTTQGMFRAGKRKNSWKRKKHPLFKVLQKVIKQHLGIDEIVTSILEKLGNVKSVAITGDYARGIDSGTIHVVLLGDGIDVGYLKGIIEKIEKKITRKVSFKIVSKLPTGCLEIYSENINVLN